MKTILLTGGTGLIGTALSKLLIDKGYQVIILTRRSKRRKPAPGIEYAEWDIASSAIDKGAVSRADIIVHLAGANVGEKRWTKKRKEEIIVSRVDSSRLIVKALEEADNKVQAVISSSAIGWYGGDKKKGAAFVETDPPDPGFLGETCRLWEESIAPVTAMGKRLVYLRTGIVLANEGGAFPQFRAPMKAGMAAILGSGRQVVSWIHIDDICRMYLAAIENESMRGPYNAVAPEPKTNKQLVLQIATSRRKPFIPVHVPEFVLRIALGEMSVEVLKSATVDSSKIRLTGFQFLFPTLESAVNELVKER